MKSSAMTAAASIAGVAGAPRFAFGQASGGKTLVKIFMRGGADGMHLFPPVGDMQYYQHRPNIAIEGPSDQDANTAIDLGHGYRALNPNLEPLMEIWDAGRMMVAPATALEESNRSHFDSMRWIETGIKNDYADGFLNRYLQNVTGTDHPLRAAVLGKTGLSTSLRGPLVVPTIRNPASFNLRNNSLCVSAPGDGCAENRLVGILDELSADHPLNAGAETTIHETHSVMLDTIAEIQAANVDYTPSAGGLEYSNTGLGQGLRMVAQLLKADVPLEVAALDFNNSWDTHAAQISSGGDRFINQGFDYHRKMKDGALDLLTFYRDILTMIDDVVVMVVTEFGRTVLENGSNGSDHGYGGAWFAFGGPCVPGIGPDIETLDVSSLREGRYIPMVTNYKDLMGEMMFRHMNMPEQLISTVFPGHTFFNHNLFNTSA